MLATAAPVRSARTLFMSMAIVMVGLGLAMSLTGVRSSLEGFSATQIGLIGAGYYMGLLPGSLMAPQIVGRVGHIRVYAGLASVAAAVILAFPAVVTVGLWVALRVLLGFCMAGLYVTAESWLNAVSTNEIRGRMLALYLLVVNLAVGGSQFLLPIADPRTAAPFAIAAALFSLSVVPITLSVAPQPSHTFEKQRIPIRQIVQTVPVGAATAVVNGLANGILAAIGAAYATSVGMTLAATGAFVGAAFIGGLVLQFPLGWLSDRFPRRKVILATTSVAGLLAIVGALVDPLSQVLPLVMFTYAAVAFPLYSIGISHVQDQVPRDLLIPASAALLAFYGVGSISGPLIASAIIQATGPSAFWWSIAASHLLLVPYAVYRLIRRAVMPRPQRPSLPVPAEAGGYFGLLVEDTSPFADGD